jgi:hypothetical protein
MTRLTSFLTPVRFDSIQTADELYSGSACSARLATSSGQHLILHHREINLNDQVVEVCKLSFRFLRSVANTLRVGSPSILTPLGWNITISQTSGIADFFWIANALTRATTVSLNPTDKQIILYGVLRALKSLQSNKMARGD